MAAYQGSWKYGYIGRAHAGWGGQNFTYEYSEVNGYMVRYGAICAYVLKSITPLRYDIKHGYGGAPSVRLDDDYNPIWDKSNSITVNNGTIIAHEVTDFEETTKDNIKKDRVNNVMFASKLHVDRKGGTPDLGYEVGVVNNRTMWGFPYFGTVFDDGYPGKSMIYGFGSHCMPGRNIYPDADTVTQEVYTDLWDKNFIDNYQEAEDGKYRASYCVISRYGNVVILKGYAAPSLRYANGPGARDYKSYIFSGPGRKLMNIPSKYRMNGSRGMVGVVYGTNTLERAIDGSDIPMTIVNAVASLKYDKSNGNLFTVERFGLENGLSRYGRQYYNSFKFGGDIRLCMFATWNIKDNGNDSG